MVNNCGFRPAFAPGISARFHPRIGPKSAPGGGYLGPVGDGKMQIRIVAAAIAVSLLAACSGPTVTRAPLERSARLVTATEIPRHRASLAHRVTRKGRVTRQARLPREHSAP